MDWKNNLLSINDEENPSIDAYNEQVDKENQETGEVTP